MIRKLIILTVFTIIFVALTVNISYSEEITYYDDTSITTQSLPTIEGRPINYPNPFKPRHGETTKITYTLSDDSNINIYIYDITGRFTRKISCLAGQLDSSGTGSGGSQGYNEVLWDGKTSYLDIAGNGVYYYFIAFQTNVLGAGQIAIYD